MTSEERRANLIEAALTCMARGGIQEFTVDKVCAEADVSRGLITHHFGSMSGLLAAVYAKMYRDSTTSARAIRSGESRLSVLLNTFFDEGAFSRESFTIWLSLWGQISIDAELRKEHRTKYAEYVKDVATAIDAVANENGRVVDALSLARALICLVDGLGIQHCLDPESMPPDVAEDMCKAFLKPQIGPF